MPFSSHTLKTLQVKDNERMWC